METTRTFPVTLHGLPCTVVANVNGRADILSVRSSGHEVHVTPDDLDAIEEAIYDERTEVGATDTRTGHTATYTVQHWGDHIASIFTPTGQRLSERSELYTEVAECFHIDRRWAMMEDSDIQGHARRCYA